MKRLQNLNGWRRLWLAATAATAVWYVGIYPLQSFNYGTVDYWYNDKLKADIADARCRAYQMEPFEKLARIEDYSAPCTHLYWSRHFDRLEHKIDTVPYTFEVHERNLSAKRWKDYAWAVRVVGFLTALGSGAVYFLGWLIGWIVAGFRPPRMTGENR